MRVSILVIYVLLSSVFALRRKSASSLEVAFKIRDSTCGGPPTIDNGVWEYVSATGSDVTYTCGEGYFNSASSNSWNSTCDSAGAYSPMYECSPVQCSVGGVLAANSTAPSDGLPATLSFGDVVRFTCLHGHSGDGKALGPPSVSYQCASNGKVVPLLPGLTDCMPIACGGLPSIENSAVSVPWSSGASLTFGQRAVYDCNSPSTSPTGGQYVSTADYKSSSIQVGCSAEGHYVFMPPGSNSTDPDVNTSESSTSTKSTDSSKGSKTTGSTGSVVRGATGSPSAFVNGILPTCVPVQCPMPPPTFDSAVPLVVSGSVFPDSLVMYSCNSGYTVRPYGTANQRLSFNARCEMDSTGMSASYVYPLDQCLPVPCSDTPVIANAADLGVVPSNGNFADGSLAGEDMTVSGSNSDQSVSPTSTADSSSAASGSPSSLYFFAQNVSFACTFGYGIDSQASQRNFYGSCDPLGNWHVNQSSGCTPVTCGTVDNIDPELAMYGVISQPASGLVPKSDLSDSTAALLSDKATLSSVSGSSSSSSASPMTSASTPYYFTDSLVITCTPGAVVTGTQGQGSSFNVECDGYGEFSSETPGQVCAIPCPPLPRISGSTSVDFGRVIEYGLTPGTVTCKDGYYVNGQDSSDTVQTVTCSRDGTLSRYDVCVPLPSTLGGDQGQQSSDNSNTLQENGYQTAMATQAQAVSDSSSDGAWDFMKRIGFYLIGALLVIISVSLVARSASH